MFKKYKNIILLLALVVFLVPKPALALWGVGDFGLFDIPDQILGGIEEKNGPMLSAAVGVFSFFLIGLTYLSLTGAFLDNFVSQQETWMANLGQMTDVGWNFISGLSNMLLVLIFIIIAFAFILKIETIQAKKALPRLIIMALLLNFSSVFVKMLIDLSQILYNTLLTDKALLAEVLPVFVGSGADIALSVISWIASLTLAWSVPFVSAGAQVVFAALVTIVILPNIITWAIQGAFFYLLGSMFFIFAILFAARVFALQIIIIMAPLAFICLILPQTKHFWSQWVKFLTEWLLVGVFFLFFLKLGLGAVKFLAPDLGPTPIPGFPLWKMGGYISYYFGLFIYMAVILAVGKKFIPQGAQALIDFGKGLVGTVVTRGLVPMGKGALSQARRGVIDQEREKKGWERDISKLNPVEKLIYKTTDKITPLTKWTARPVNFLHRMAGTTPQIEEANEQRKKISKEFKKYESADSNQLKELFGEQLTRAARLAIASVLSSRGDFNDLEKTSAKDKNGNPIDKRKTAHKDAIEHEPYSDSYKKEFFRADPTAVFRDGPVKDYYEKLTGVMGDAIKALEKIKLRPKDMESLPDESFRNKDGKINDKFVEHLAKLNPEHWSKLSDNSKVSESTHSEIAKILTTMAENKELDSSLLRSFVSRPNLSRYIIPKYNNIGDIDEYEKEKNSNSGGTNP
jgi:hypothetical protein